MPPLLGSPLRVEWANALHNVRGRLHVGGERGLEVHAASFVRERRMVFDRVLRRDPAEMSRIVIHELFHFAWIRLSNEARQGWKQLLLHEIARRARGELGWSAESRKCAIRSAATVTSNRTWNEYACESFCDTAAWIYSTAQEHREFTLARRYREIRLAWFRIIESHRGGAVRI